jgi:hypothetical protein
VSNTLIAVTHDDKGDVNAVVWSGSAWGGATQLATNSPGTDRRQMDVAFEPRGTRALAVYRQGNGHSAHCRVYDGASWGGASSTPSLGDRPGIIQLAPYASGSQILVGIRRQGDGGLCVVRWSGTDLEDDTVLAPALGGPLTTENFALLGGAGGMHIVSWREVDPN